MVIGNVFLRIHARGKEPRAIERSPVCNNRARVFCQILTRGLSYAGSRAVCLPSKRQKMSRNNLWKFT